MMHKVGVSKRGLAVMVAPYYKMSESDWVVLRLVQDTEASNSITGEQARSLDYLIKQYGEDVVRDCILELHRSHV